MKIFRKEELIGEWSSEIFRISLFENMKSKIDFLLTKSQYEGTFRIFENFLVLKFIKKDVDLAWVLRLDNKQDNSIELTDLSMNVGQHENLKKTFFDISFLKKFNFERLEFLNIDEIKERLNVLSIPLNTMKNKSGSPTNFLRFWNNNERFSIAVKKELAEKIKINKQLPLIIEKEIKQGALGFYTSFLITEYLDVESNDYDLKNIYDDYYYNTNNWLIDAAGTNDPEVVNDVEWNLD